MGGVHLGWGVHHHHGAHPKVRGVELLPVRRKLHAFGFGNQFSQLGYRTMAFHDYLYTYYDRDKSFPNMGYEYYAWGTG